MQPLRAHSDTLFVGVLYHPDGHAEPMLQSMRLTQQAVEQFIGAIYAPVGGTTVDGWSRAYDRGWRVHYLSYTGVLN